MSYSGVGGGKVVKADITTEWYNYGSKNWANAVILKDGIVDDYKPNEEIKESDIESYFVWIPRYKYKLKNSEEEFNKYETVTAEGLQTDIASFYKAIGGNKGETEAFDIVFETKNDGVKIGNTINTYITHPAFTSFDSNGFWVGKFETGYNQNDSNDNVVPNANTWNATGAEKNEDKTEKIIIKPNVYSWRNIQVANAFYTSYNYQRDLESHMMKNMEWGAVAYLTQSLYGRCTEKEGKMTCGEVRINNSWSYITGMSAKEAPTCGGTDSVENCNWYETTALTKDGEKIQSYYNKENNEASTTGNYSGIYDMSGGAWEYVMGVIQSSKDGATPATGPNKDNNSGFNGPYSNLAGMKEDGQPWPSSKYYDLYDYDNSDQHYYRGKLGDGTKEFGPFYSVSYPKTNAATTSGPTRYVGSYNADVAYFANPGYPWILRGGVFSFGMQSGVAAFYSMTGYINNSDSFRIVLTP